MGAILVFVAKRLLLLIPILLGASIVVFLLVHLAPGDEATVLLGPLAHRRKNLAVRTLMGHNWPQQSLRYA